MVTQKKLFALASVSALGGLVSVVSASGCSSTEIVPVPAEGGTTDAKTDAKKPPLDLDEPAEVSCKDSSAAFAPVKFNAAADQSGTACTAAVITALADACPLNKDPNTEASCTAARALAANKTCAECIYGAKTDTKDKPITLTPGEKPGFQLNQHICFDHFTKVPGCGAEFINVANCFDNYCDLVENGKKCTSDAEVSSCVKEVRDQECKQYLITDQTCGEGIQTAKLCFPTANTAAAYKQFYIEFTTQACATSGGGQTDGG
jgi:hypothetical protein